MSAPQLNQILDRADPLLGERFHMFHVGGGTDGFLDRVDDALFDVERGSTFVDDTDERDRDLDVGKEIDGEPVERGGPEDHHG